MKCSFVDYNNSDNFQSRDIIFVDFTNKDERFFIIIVFNTLESKKNIFVKLWYFLLSHFNKDTFRSDNLYGIETKKLKGTKI